MAPEPIRLGLLFDFPQHDGGESFAHAVRTGIADAAGARLDREIELVSSLAVGLPSGTAFAVETAFRDLVDQGVLAIVGPSISDNGIIVRDHADAVGVACINYTGGAITRSEWMFHYQVGSLEEEPAVLADHLAASGLTRVAVVHDHSPVGNQYAYWFQLAGAATGIEVSAAASIASLADDAADLVARMRTSDPDALVYLGLGVAARTVALAVESAKWELPVVANSALMFGYAQKEWRAAWEGWVYVDTLSDDNEQRAALAERDRRTAAGPVGVAAYDIGRMLGEAIVRTDHLTRDGIRSGLERVKRLPATSGHAGTTMGFGQWDHAALKGDYLVLRQWLDGRTQQYPR